MPKIQALLAEFIGTFLFFFAGIGAILGNTNAVGSHGGLIAIAFAHGLGLTIAVMCFGGVSGGHFNPAVSIGLMSTGRVRPATAGAYVVVQLIAAVAAAAACKFVFPEAAVAEANLGIPLPAAFAGNHTVLLVEFILTFFLMTAIYGTAIEPRGAGVKIGAFGIGLTVMMDILAGGPVTGASMNPARSFGPAFVQGYWTWHPLYWIAPVAGAVAAALVYEHLILEKKNGGRS